MRRGDLWFAEVGFKRLVLLLPRSEVLDGRSLVTVVEITAGPGAPLQKLSTTSRSVSTARQ